LPNFQSKSISIKQNLTTKKPKDKKSKKKEKNKSWNSSQWELSCII